MLAQKIAEKMIAKIDEFFRDFDDEKKREILAFVIQNAAEGAARGAVKGLKDD